MIGGIILLFLGAFGVGGLIFAIGMAIDNETLINIGIMVLLGVLAIIVLFFIVGGICLLRGEA